MMMDCGDDFEIHLFFEKAIAESNIYDQDIRDISAKNKKCSSNL